jgi:hypothetical protein
MTPAAKTSLGSSYFRLVDVPASTEDGEPATSVVNAPVLSPRPSGPRASALLPFWQNELTNRSNNEFLC